MQWGRMPLHEASVKNPGVIGLLLEAGADINHADTTGATALHWAARCSLECVMTLLSHGAHPLQTAQDNTTAADIAAPDSAIRARLVGAGEAVASGQQGAFRGGAALALAAAQRVYPPEGADAAVDVDGGLTAGLIALLRHAVQFFHAQKLPDVALQLEQVRRQRRPSHKCYGAAVLPGTTRAQAPTFGSSPSIRACD